MGIAQQAREAFDFARNPNNHDYAERMTKFGQVVLALCVGQVTYEELDTTEEGFNEIQQGFAEVVDCVFEPIT